MTTTEQWDAQVDAGRNNTWVHSDHKNVSAYALGQSQGGWGSKSSWGGSSLSSSPAATAPSSSPISFASSGTISPPAIFGRAGGGLSGSSGSYINKSQVVGSVLKFIFTFGLFFGIYDYVTNKADVSHSATVAAGTAYGLSDAVGKKIEGIGVGPIFAWAGWGVRWGIAIPGGLAAGTGAGVGNFGSSLVNAFYEGFTSTRNRTKTAQNTTATVTALGLNLRSGPGTDFGKVAFLPQGAQGTVVGHQNGWLELDNIRGSAGENFHGFANAVYLRED